MMTWTARFVGGPLDGMSRAIESVYASPPGYYRVYAHRPIDIRIDVVPPDPARSPAIPIDRVEYRVVESSIDFTRGQVEYEIASR